jgi:hypothetical protein
MNRTIESIQLWFSQNASSENVTTFGIIVIGIFLVISIYKLLKSFHITMVIFVLGLLCTGLFLYWVHNRNEPGFMTPAVEAVADFLPKKGELREISTPQ